MSRLCCLLPFCFDCDLINRHVFGWKALEIILGPNLASNEIQVSSRGLALMRGAGRIAKTVRIFLFLRDSKLLISLHVYLVKLLGYIKNANHEKTAKMKQNFIVRDVRMLQRPAMFEGPCLEVLLKIVPRINQGNSTVTLTINHEVTEFGLNYYLIVLRKS